MGVRVLREIGLAAALLMPVAPAMAEDASCLAAIDDMRAQVLAINAILMGKDPFDCDKLLDQMVDLGIPFRCGSPADHHIDVPSLYPIVEANCPSDSNKG